MDAGSTPANARALVMTRLNDLTDELLIDAPADDDYWSHARRPMACLLFLCPLLILYETGVLCLGGDQPELIRNGADHWMRTLLSHAGFAQTLLLPAIVVVGLLAWQVWGKFSWRVAPATLLGMAAESLLFAFALVVLGQMQDVVLRHSVAPIDSPPIVTEAQAATLVAMQSLPRAVSFLGAGVYEEVLFRLCLLPGCYGLFRLLCVPRKQAAVVSIILTSLVFSVAHYVGPTADQFSAFTFSFRLFAGLFFAGLFVLRGFGITAGCHAAYDVLVGVLLQS
jgi:membrane protease YdiL (CAAX protease family)